MSEPTRKVYHVYVSGDEWEKPEAVVLLKVPSEYTGRQHIDMGDYDIWAYSERGFGQKSYVAIGRAIERHETKQP